MPSPFCRVRLSSDIQSLLPLAMTAGQEGVHLAFIFSVIVSPQVHINIQYDVNCGFFVDALHHVDGDTFVV